MPMFLVFSTVIYLVYLHPPTFSPKTEPKGARFDAGFTATFEMESCGTQNGDFA
jgi:hypothetical protein